MNMDYSVQNISPLNSVLSHLNPAHTSTCYFFKMTLILYSHLGLGFFPSGLLTKISLRFSSPRGRSWFDHRNNIRRISTWNLDPFSLVWARSNLLWYTLAQSHILHVKWPVLQSLYHISALPQFLQAYAGLVLKIGYNCSLPHPFKSNIHSPPNWRYTV
jgi:hypothetical protein